MSGGAILMSFYVLKKAAGSEGGVDKMSKGLRKAPAVGVLIRY